MNYFDFEDSFISALEQEVKNQYPNKSVVTRDFQKTNAKGKAVFIKSMGIEDEKLPIYYMEALFSEYCKSDLSLKEYAQEFLKAYFKFQETMNFCNPDKEYILKMLFPLPVNPTKNRAILKTAPSKDLLNLKITYRALIFTPDGGIASCLVNNDMMNHFNITLNELEEAVNKNRIPANIEQIDNQNIFIVSTRYNYFGSTYLINYEPLRNISKKIKDDLIVVPKSSDTLLVYPKSQSEIISTIRKVLTMSNQAYLNSDDIRLKELYLSDSLYTYDRKLDKIGILVNF